MTRDVMAPDGMDMYCTICCSSIYEPGRMRSKRSNQSKAWLGQAVLLHAQEDQDQIYGSTILELPSKNTCGPYFNLLETDQAVAACNLQHPFVNRYPALYLPCHVSCLSIAYQVVTHIQVDRIGNNALRHIWRILQARFKAASTYTSDRQTSHKLRFYFRSPVNRLKESHGYCDLAKFQALSSEP